MRIIFEDGRIFEGNWRNGRQDGWGINYDEGHVLIGYKSADYMTGKYYSIPLTNESADGYCLHDMGWTHTPDLEDKAAVLHPIDGDKRYPSFHLKHIFEEWHDSI